MQLIISVSWHSVIPTALKHSIWSERCKLELLIVILKLDILYMIYCTRFFHFNIVEIAHLLKLVNFFSILMLFMQNCFSEN